MLSRYFKVVAILVLALSLSTCKKDDGDDAESSNVFEVYQTLNNTRDKFYEYGEAQNGNYKEAIVLTGAWVETQPGVKSVFYEDSINIYITMQSGLKTHLSVNETDAQGNSLYRGGGSGGTFKRSPLSGTCTNNITNKKVLIYAAAYDDFYRNDPSKLTRVVDLFEDADPEFEVTLLKNAQCTPEIVETFGNYGFVSIETHGHPESFLSGIKLDLDSAGAITSNTQLIDYIGSSLGSQYAQKFTEGKIQLSDDIKIDVLDAVWWQNRALERRYSINISSDYIQSLAPTPNTIIVGNMCYSGYGTQGSCNTPGGMFFDLPIRNAFESINPISYYCYAFNNGVSATVLDRDAKEMLWQLTNSLLGDGDSTGNAHLTDAGVLREVEKPASRVYTQCGSPFYFQQFSKSDYCYKGCGDSITDARDGQKYATVCIGDQVWMAENLNWAGAGLCYDGNGSNCDTYGRLYNIDELTSLDTSSANPSGIQGICPQGWHVPSQAEWQELIDFAGGASVAAGKLKATSGWPTPGTDDYGFRLLGGGFLNSAGGTSIYERLDEVASLWTTNKQDNSNLYIAFSVSAANATFSSYTPPPQFDWKFSCRCVKD